MTEDLQYLHSSFAKTVQKPPSGLLDEKDFFCGMVSRSGSMKKVFERIEGIAREDDDVLVIGQPGTGKRLIVDAIHKLSSRSKGPFVSLNCGVIPEGLLEAELFGIPDSRREKGRLEAAAGGILFLNEIGNMSWGAQVRLVELIEQRDTGGIGTPFDVRIMASTSRDLEQAVAEGAFEGLLLKKLGKVSVSLPKLSERKEDIPLLITHFSQRYGPKTLFEDEVAKCLASYDWPGNVSELENLIERLVAVKDGGWVGVADLPTRYLPTRASGTGCFVELPKDGVDLRVFLAGIENSLIDQALSRTGGNRNRAAALLGIKRTTLIEKLKKRGF